MSAPRRTTAVPAATPCTICHVPVGLADVVALPLNGRTGWSRYAHAACAQERRTAIARRRSKAAATTKAATKAAAKAAQAAVESPETARIRALMAQVSSR